MERIGGKKRWKERWQVEVVGEGEEDGSIGLGGLGGRGHVHEGRGKGGREGGKDLREMKMKSRRGKRELEKQEANKREEKKIEREEEKPRDRGRILTRAMSSTHPPMVLL